MKEPIGPFDILEITASGTYGSVAVARPAADPEGPVLALKVLRQAATRDPKRVQRSRDEARMLYRLAHPNIVRVERLIEVHGRPVVAMEWVRGVSLRQLLDQDGPPPLEVSLEIARQMALALNAAFDSVGENGARLAIIHRDIKPSNALIDVDGCVKVVDFGIARGNFADREARTQLTLLGTAGYIAPERREGRGRDTPAVDVYGLGVTLFELIAGRNLVVSLEEGRHDMELATQLLELHADEDNPCLRACLDLIQRMCQADPRGRPDTSEVVVELWQLSRLLGAEPDLVAFAEARVLPLWEARPQHPPRQHPDYADLAFLEEPWEYTTEVRDVPDGIPRTLVTERETANRRLRRCLADPGWEHRTRALTWLLATNPDWSPEPFLEALDAIDAVAWWQVFKKRDVPRKLEICLQMLRYRRTPEVLHRVAPLADHPDPAVSAAARVVLGITPAPAPREGSA